MVRLPPTNTWMQVARNPVITFQWYQLCVFSIAVEPITANLVQDVNSFSQFLCIRDWSLPDLCLLFGIPIASAHVSLGCFPFWTWPCLASSCSCRQKSVPFSCTNELPILLVFSRGYSESLEATRHSFAQWLSLTTWQLTTSSPAGEILALVCSGWVLDSVTNSKGLSHHLCHTIEPNQESTYSATFVLVSCLQASHNSTHTGAERRL